MEENSQDDTCDKILIHGLEGYAFHSKGPTEQSHNCRSHFLG